MSLSTSSAERRLPWRLPIPFKDEMVYGLLARFQAGWAYIDHAGLLRQALGFEAWTFHPLAAPSVSRLSTECLGVDAASEELLDRHTLLPYYTAFSPPSKIAMLERAVRQDVRHLVTTFICRTALSTGQHRFLNVCRACMEHDARADGQAYWHRIHQLPGVHLCSVHRTKLWRTEVAVETSKAVKLLRPSDVAPSSKPLRRVEAGFDRELAAVLNGASGQLLQRRCFAHEAWTGSYRHVALTLGYRSRRFEVSENRFGDDFSRWLGNRCLKPESIGPSRWWRCLFSGVKGHPTVLQHLLTRCFLAERMSEKVGRTIGPLDAAIDCVVKAPASRLRRGEPAGN